jgi:flagellar biosynthesis protein FlhG
MQPNYLGRTTRTISVGSGKGGVGKTSLICNLALALTNRGRKVLILDGDLGMANVDIFFGLKSDCSLLDVIHGEKSINECIRNVDKGIDLLPGGSGLVELQRLNAFQRRQIVSSLDAIEGQYDYMLIDTAPGISDNVLQLHSAAQKTAIIINPDPAALTDAYSLIKVLHHEHKENHFAIVCNQVRDEVEGLALFNKFNDIVARFLLVGLDYWGGISQDSAFRRATQGQRLILRQDPSGDVARQVTGICDKMERGLARMTDKSGIQFFWDQAVGVA